MIEAKMPKDIRVYETKLIGPLTLRQTICLCVAIFVDIVLYVTVIKPFHVNIRLVVYLIMFADVPIFAFTYKPMGMALEKYLKNAWNIRDMEKIWDLYEKQPYEETEERAAFLKNYLE